MSKGQRQSDDQGGQGKVQQNEKVFQSIQGFVAVLKAKGRRCLFILHSQDLGQSYANALGESRQGPSRPSPSESDSLQDEDSCQESACFFIRA